MYCKGKDVGFSLRSDESFPFKRTRGSEYSIAIKIYFPLVSAGFFHGLFVYPEN
jgi:hypothetical protein